MRSCGFQPAEWFFLNVSGSPLTPDGPHELYRRAKDCFGLAAAMASQRQLEPSTLAICWLIIVIVNLTKPNDFLEGN
jgi:hypothetical protein